LSAADMAIWLICRLTMVRLAISMPYRPMTSSTGMAAANSMIDTPDLSPQTA
jgi:hypothetical protein